MENWDRTCSVEITSSVLSFPCPSGYMNLEFNRTVWLADIIWSYKSSYWWCLEI